MNSRTRPLWHQLLSYKKYYLQIVYVMKNNCHITYMDAGIGYTKYTPHKNIALKLHNKIDWSGIPNL